ncbi:hypothetical protein KLU848_2947 [Kluyveromyces marxianus]
MNLKALHQILIVFSIIVSSVCAVSENFKLELHGPKQLKGMVIYYDDNSILIGKKSPVSLINGTIQDDGSLKLGTDEFIGIKKNYLTVTNNFTEYALPFKIDSKGFLNLYGEKEFKAIPNGETETWILASKNAVSTLSSSYTVKVKCVNNKGKKVDKFSIKGSGASELQAGSIIYPLGMIMTSLYLII